MANPTEEVVMAEAQRRAEVVWHGNLTQGSGTARLVSSGVFGEFPVSWPARTERPDGKTSPEELLAAAHAACYAMAFSNVLNGKGSPPERLEVAATYAFEPGPGVKRVELEVRGTVPGMDAGEFERAAAEGEQACPVSNAVRGNVEISLVASLAE